MTDWKVFSNEIGATARRAALQLAATDGAARSAALRKIAVAIRSHSDAICAANAQDLEQAQKSQLAPALLERLKLCNLGRNAMNEMTPTKNATETNRALVLAGIKGAFIDRDPAVLDSLFSENYRQHNPQITGSGNQGAFEDASR